MSIRKIACVGGYTHEKTNVQLQFGTCTDEWLRWNKGCVATNKMVLSH